jgi:hypothetical protein
MKRQSAWGDVRRAQLDFVCACATVCVLTLCSIRLSRRHLATEGDAGRRILRSVRGQRVGTAPRNIRQTEHASPAFPPTGMAAANLPVPMVTATGATIKTCGMPTCAAMASATMKPLLVVVMTTRRAPAKGVIIGRNLTRGVAAKAAKAAEADDRSTTPEMQARAGGGMRLDMPAGIKSVLHGVGLMWEDEIAATGEGPVVGAGHLAGAVRHAPRGKRPTCATIHERGCQRLTWRHATGSRGDRACRRMTRRVKCV